MNKPFIALDITTTGPDPKRDRVTGVSTLTVDWDGSCTERAFAAADGESKNGSRARAWSTLASELRRDTADRWIVTHDASSALAVLSAEGIRLSTLPFDLVDLASILVPGLPSPDLATLAAALGVEPLTIAASARAALMTEVFQRLQQRIGEYDDLTRERLEVHVYEGGWPFFELFSDRMLGSRNLDAGEKLLAPELAYLRERPRSDPLEPTGSIDPIDVTEVQRIVAPSGALAEVIAGFERRPQQEQMAAAVLEVLNESGQLLVEAGTGTGKSLAYLVPSALSSAERGETVVLSTNTLALQDQLLHKDVPDLIAALRESGDRDPVNVVAVKGRANYLCLRRWFPWERQPSLDQDEARLKAKVLAWLPRTTTGDRAELRLTGAEEAHWRQISEEEGACDPGSCVFHQRGQCFVFRARREAESAHLVVVNHALLLTDAASSNRILPDYDALVIDEAHHLEDQATSQFTVSVTEREIVEYAEAIASTDGGSHAGVAAGAVAFLLGAVADASSQRLARVARETFDSALTFADLLRGSSRELFAALELVHLESAEFSSGTERTRRVTAATRGAPAWQAVDAAWDRVLEAMRGAETALRWFISAVDSVDDVAAADLADAGERQELLLLDMGNIVRAGSEIVAKLASAFDAPEPDRVYWLERQGFSERIALRSAPLDVSGLLAERLFNKTRATVLTSATLAIDGRCDYLASRLGIPDASSLIVPSPFDYRRNVLLYLADDAPEPTLPSYRDMLERTLIDVIDASRGRALVLFTSHALLSDLARAITPALQDRGITVLAQRRDGAPQQLVERLRREPDVAILGTSSFWEGVDVAGEALSLLVITRLPFSVPTDPVFAARSEAFENAFSDYAVPQAVLRFKQGFGRLIRSSRDRGVCVVMDRRILTKRYGATFLQSLPDCTVEVGSTYDLSRATREWLDVEAAIVTS